MNNQKLKISERKLFKNIVKSDAIWYEQPSILFSLDKITNFFPSEISSYSEKMNSIVRFSIYLSIILVIIKQNYLYLYIFIITALVTFLLYKNNQQQTDLTENYEHSKCTEPTQNNPFMNVLLTDYKDNPNRKSCVINNQTKKKMSKNFNHNLYKDVSDVYEKSNSQRQYYTMPSTTIPNDQTSFAKWLYKVPSSCKSGDGIQCANLQPKNMQLPNQLYKYT